MPLIRLVMGVVVLSLRTWADYIHSRQDIVYKFLDGSDQLKIQLGNGVSMRGCLSIVYHVFPSQPYRTTFRRFSKTTWA